MGGQGWPGDAQAPKSSNHCGLMACPMAAHRAGGKRKGKTRCQRKVFEWSPFTPCRRGPGKGGPVALWAGGGLQSWGKPRWGPSPMAQPSRAPGSEGRAETCLWEWWCFLALRGEERGVQALGFLS